MFVVPFNKVRMPKKADPGWATIVFVHSLHTHTHTHYYTTILLLLDTAKPGWWSSNEVRQLCVSTTKIAEGLWVTNVTYLGNSPDYKSCVWDNWTCTITGITPPRHVICTHDMITRTHDMYPRHVICTHDMITRTHDMYPRHVPMTCTHDMYP